MTLFHFSGCVLHCWAAPGKFGIKNIVTTVLASYRGYDTLGETAVIFTAGIAVMLLLRRRPRDEEEAP